MNENPSLRDLWSPRECVEEVEHVWEAGTLRCRYRRSGREWATMQEPLGADSAAHTRTPAEPVWNRWAFNAAVKRLDVQPTMPDRPLLVRTMVPLRLPPESQVKFYISIPVFAAFLVETGDSPTEIARYPTTALANTWFGLPYGTGLLSYALKSQARLDLGEMRLSTHRAICPFMVENKDDEALLIEEICVQTRHLNIFRGAERLWTSPVRVVYRGSEHQIRLDYPRGAPPESGKPTLVRPAEVEPGSGFLRKAMHINPFFSTH